MSGFERMPAMSRPRYPAGYLDLVCPNDECPGTIERAGAHYRHTWALTAERADRDPDRKCCAECHTEGVEEGTIDSTVPPVDESTRERDEALEALAIQYDSVRVRELSLGRARARCYDDTPGGPALVATFIVHPDGRRVGT